MHQVIRLHLAAPPKPAPDQPCNGCGVCCASAPCPLGILASRRISGSCAALGWSEEEGRYRCGLIAQPAEHLPRGLRWAAPALARLAHRHIAAGAGCDCSLSADPFDADDSVA